MLTRLRFATFAILQNINGTQSKHVYLFGYKNVMFQGQMSITALAGNVNVYN